MSELPLSQVYQFLEPGPVVLLTTTQHGRNNVMTMSWHMMVEFVPPLVACVVSSEDYSFAALTAEHECVIAIPAMELAPTVVKVGNTSGRTMDKFKKFVSRHGLRNSWRHPSSLNASLTSNAELWTRAWSISTTSSSSKW
jgi:hypothetical protein